VPPLRNGSNTYEALAYMDGVENAYYYKRMAVIDRGQPKVWPLIHHYDISALVLNTISEGKYCQTQTCEFLKGGDSDSSLALPYFKSLYSMPCKGLS